MSDHPFPTIHSILPNPWNLTSVGLEEWDPAIARRVTLSSNTVAAASRDGVLITKDVTDINPATPRWLVVFYPLVGLINLFIHVLKYPTLPTALSDIALMEVVAGHFSYLEFITFSNGTFPVARDLVSQARAAVQKAKLNQLQSIPMNVAERSENSVEPEESERPSSQTDIFGFDEMPGTDAFDISLENWFTISSSQFNP